MALFKSPVERLQAEANRLLESGDSVKKLAGRIALLEPVQLKSLSRPFDIYVDNTDWTMAYAEPGNPSRRIYRTLRRQMFLGRGNGNLSVYSAVCEISAEDIYIIDLEHNAKGTVLKLGPARNPDQLNADELTEEMIVDIESGLMTTVPERIQTLTSLRDTTSNSTFRAHADDLILEWYKRNLGERS